MQILGTRQEHIFLHTNGWGTLTVNGTAWGEYPQITIPMGGDPRREIRAALRPWRVKAGETNPATLMAAARHNARRNLLLTGAGGKLP